MPRLQKSKDYKIIIIRIAWKFNEKESLPSNVQTKIVSLKGKWEMEINYALNEEILKGK